MLTLAIAIVATVVSAEGPCDILQAAGNPCVAAHSTVRALYQNYNGKLYNVTRSSDGTSTNINTLNSGGFADKPAHDAFCSKLDCVISNVFDQSTNGNHLGQRHKLVNASLHPITVGAEKTPVYGMWFGPGFGYHVDKTKNIATGNDPESIYAVMSGKNYNGGCCFDYGNSETDDHDDGCGTMEAIYFGDAHWHGNAGAGAGPWAGADLEQGMYYGGGAQTQINPQSQPLTYDFVALVLKGRTDGFTIKGGDATSGTTTTMYDGPRPNKTIAGTCGGGAGGLLTLQTCVKGNAQQMWHFSKDGKSISNGNDQCIDIEGFATRKGSQIWAYACGQGSRSNEYWKADQASHTISSQQLNTPFCLGASGTVSGAGAILDECAADSSVVSWVGFDTASGSGAIVQNASGLCFTGFSPVSAPGYQPMRKQGAIILATGGDQSNDAKGNFYEGFMATGYASDATDAKIQENIVAVGYSGFTVPQ